MLAHAFLSVMAVTEPPPRNAGLIPLTRNEIRRFLATAEQPTHSQAFR